MDKSKISILVIDDDKDVNRNIEKTLLREGYTVDKAYDCLSGIEKIKQSNFHLVISDLNMPDLNGRLSKRAGLELLKWIRENHPELLVIMLTAAGTIQSAKEALLTLGASDFLEKTLERDELKEKVIAVIQHNINYDLEIKLQPGTKLKMSEDEEILRRLFTDTSKINVTPFALGTRGTAVYWVDYKDEVGIKGPFAVKTAWKDQVLIEQANYHKWVKDRISGSRYADIIDLPVFTSRRGGIKMSLLNAKAEGLHNFQTFFRTNSSVAIQKTIENLFEETLSNWYRFRKEEFLFLVQEYVNYLEVDKWNLGQAMNSYLKEFAGVVTIYLEEIDKSFPNPIILFEQLLKSQQDSKIRTYVSTVHGDLNATNIMVDNENNTWLIDFTNTGTAHILRDYVEVETAVKFSVVETENLAELCELEACLISQETFHDNLEFAHPNAEIQKTFETVKLIREKASKIISPNDDFLEYYIGLLFHTLTMLRFPEKAVSKVKKKQILFSASRILEQLQSHGFKL